jgi:hypothetical protein
MLPLILLFRFSHIAQLLTVTKNVIEFRSGVFDNPGGPRFLHDSAMLLRILFILATLISVTAFARLGETETQFVDRYGEAKDTPASKITDKNFPLLEGAIHHTYEYQGWKIRAAFA